MASKVFISWGGDLSKKLAEEVKNWLPSVLQFVKPYFTPDDIEKGTRWESNIATELATSNIGIICLTKDNINRPWILFEAGALSKNFGKSNVCTILFNIESTQITGPLTSFQATKFDKTDFKKLIKTINETGEDAKLDSKVLDEVFEMWWPKLEEKVNNIISSHKEEVKSKQRPEREILEEILQLTRLNTKRPVKRSDSAQIALRRLLASFDKIQMQYMERDLISEKHFHMMYLEEFYRPIEMLCMELDCPELFERFMMKRNQYMHMNK